jgi:hypothetical protein
MEDVLAVYTQPRDPDYPLVCLDETSKQFLAETRLPPISLAPPISAPSDDSQFAKSPHSRALLALQRLKSPGLGMPGWRRSADRTCLQENSLLTGNFAISGPR